MPLPGDFHPSQPATIFFANISPKPSMTPLTNGSTMFIPKLEINAPNLVCIDRFESNIASVAEVGTGLASGERVPCGFSYRVISTKIPIIYYYYLKRIHLIFTTDQIPHVCWTRLSSLLHCLPVPTTSFLLLSGPNFLPPSTFPLRFLPRFSRLRPP